MEIFCQEKIKDLSSWKAILLMQNHTIEHDYRSYRYRLYRTIREIHGMDRNGEKLVDFFRRVRPFQADHPEE